jgi:hypothetical protein
MLSVMKNLAAIALGVFTLFVSVPSAAKAQVAYIPQVGFVPTGATMTVTPAVSADRRYVRLSVNAFFNDLNGFSTFSFPGAAVSGGQNFGGFGAGINAGMDGIIGDDSYQSGVQVANGMNAAAAGNQANGFRAGPLLGEAGPGNFDPMFSGARTIQGNGLGVMPGFESDEAELMFAMENGTRPNVRASAKDRARSPRRPLRKPKSKPARKDKVDRNKSR